MKLTFSEAIGLGALYMKPIKGGRSIGEKDVGCALDMAAFAIGLDIRDGGKIREFWPWLTQDTILNIARHFDREVMCQGETFEHFLDWIRSMEPAPAAAEQQVAEAEVSHELPTYEIS